MGRGFRSIDTGISLGGGHSGSAADLASANEFGPTAYPEVSAAVNYFAVSILKDSGFFFSSSPSEMFWSLE